MTSKTTKNCPLCQQNNGCAMAIGLDLSSCWCQESAVSFVDVLAQYAAANPELLLVDNQCVCQPCIDKLVQLRETSTVQFFSPVA